MLSKAELNENYEECLREFTIRRDANEKKFSEAYLTKALHNLELAGVLDILSRFKYIYFLCCLKNTFSAFILN